MIRSMNESARAKDPQEQGEKFPYRKSYPALAKVMAALIGTDNAGAIARHLGHGISRRNVIDWRRGRSGIPAWVLEKTRAQLRLLQIELDKATPGPGRTGDIQQRLAKKKNPAA